MVATPAPTLEETAAQKHSQEKQAFTAEQNRCKKQVLDGIHELANLPAPLDCFLPHCSPLPIMTTGADPNLAREKWLSSEAQTALLVLGKVEAGAA